MHRKVLLRKLIGNPLFKKSLKNSNSRLNVVAWGAYSKGSSDEANN